jgi:hypothetical protein
LSFGRVFGYTQHDRAGTLQLLELIAEATRLDRSAGGVRFGKEEEHDGLAAKVF